MYHCKKFWVIALPNFGQMYALPQKNGQKPNFFGYDKQKPKVDFGFCMTQSTTLGINNCVPSKLG